MQCVQPQSRIRTKSILFFVTVLSLTASFGCPQRKVVLPAKPFVGQTIQVIVPDGPARMVMERHGQVWARKADAKLKFVTPAANQSATGDLIVFNPAQMGDLVKTSRLDRVPEAITNGGSWAGLSRLYRNKLLLWGETAYALPLVGDATFLIYRADLLKESGKTPPKTFAEFAEWAKQLAESRKKPSLPPIGDDDALDRTFHTIAAGLDVSATTEDDLKNKKVVDTDLTSRFRFQFDTKTGEPRLTSQGFVSALGTLQDTQPFRSNKSNLVEAIRNDEAVIGFGTLRDLAQLQPASNPGKYAVAPIPVGYTGERVPYTGPGGFIAGVMKDSPHAAAGWDLLNYLSSTEVSLEVVHDPSIGSAPYRGAHLTERRDGWFNYGLDPAGTERLREALGVAVDPRVINAPARLRIPREEEYRQALLEGIRSALTNKTDPNLAMDNINRRWQELDTKVPKEQRLMDYLRSLNLRP